MTVIIILFNLQKNYILGEGESLKTIIPQLFGYFLKYPNEDCEYDIFCSVFEYDI